MPRCFDYCTKDIVPDPVMQEFCKAFNMEPREIAAFFELVWVVPGPGWEKLIARECKECGAPMGNTDPDKAKWIRLGVCRDCS